MKQYRKIPVCIEAVKFDGRNKWKVEEFIGEKLSANVVSDTAYNAGVLPPIFELTIKTLEGYMKVTPGDYVIKGVKGEFYPCKPDIFEMTYEEVF